jgi:hypothetical protein
MSRLTERQRRERQVQLGRINDRLLNLKFRHPLTFSLSPLLGRPSDSLPCPALEVPGHQVERSTVLARTAAVPLTQVSERVFLKNGYPHCTTT